MREVSRNGQNIIRAYAENIHAKAGHGERGFRGVALWKPTGDDENVLMLGPFPPEQRDEAQGVVFNYGEIMEIHENGQPVWRQPAAGEETEDLDRIGEMSIDFFDSPEIRAVLDAVKETLVQIGVE